MTWELRSGGLRGHLVSEEPRVSLSLWPDEDYVVQVSLVCRAREVWERVP